MLLGYPLADLAILVGISLLICITVCTLATEAAVLFTPAFMFVFVWRFPGRDGRESGRRLLLLGTGRGDRRHGRRAAGVCTTHYAPTAGDPGDPLEFDSTDTAIKGLAGILAGLLGIAVDELTNTMLTVRKRLPVQLAVGTAAFVLHISVLAALVVNIAILRIQPPGIDMAGFSIPLASASFSHRPSSSADRSVRSSTRSCPRQRRSGR